MAELADALASGASPRKGVWVQVPLPAPNSTNPNLFLGGDGSGFLLLSKHPSFIR